MADMTSDRPTGSRQLAEGELPAWSERASVPVMTCWGAVVPQPWRLVVIDPINSTAEAVSERKSLRRWAAPAKARSAALGAAALCLVGGVGLGWVSYRVFSAITTTDGSTTAVTLLADLVALVAAPVAIVLLIAAWRSFQFSRVVPVLPPSARCWSVSLQPDTWGFVQRMNNHARGCDRATHDAIHALLWALTHTDDRSAHIGLIGDLASVFETATEKPDLASVRSATARIWALIP